MRTTFKQYPAYAKVIILVYAINIAIIAGYRLVGMFRSGVVVEGTSDFLNIFSLVMNIAAPAAIYLLIADTKRGLWLVFGAIMALFIYDALILFSFLGARYASAFYYYEIIFSIFVLFSFPIIRYLVKTRNKSGVTEYA